MPKFDPAVPCQTLCRPASRRGGCRRGLSCLRPLPFAAGPSSIPSRATVCTRACTTPASARARNVSKEMQWALQVHRRPMVESVIVSVHNRCRADRMSRCPTEAVISRVRQRRVRADGSVQYGKERACLWSRSVIDRHPFSRCACFDRVDQTQHRLQRSCTPTCSRADELVTIHLISSRPSPVALAVRPSAAAASFRGHSARTGRGRQSHGGSG